MRTRAPPGFPEASGRARAADLGRPGLIGFASPSLDAASPHPREELPVRVIQVLSRRPSLSRRKTDRRRRSTRPALEQAERRVLLANAISLTPFPWPPVGPDQVSESYPGATAPGRVNAIAISPNFDGHGTPAMFLGT